MKLCGFDVGLDQRFFLIAGPCVVESEQLQLEVAGTLKEITGKLQVRFMDELPMIPLWYNGAWAQMSTTTWTNWPADGTDRQFIPISWRGWLQMTGLDTITHLEPAGQ